MSDAEQKEILEAVTKGLAAEEDVLDAADRLVVNLTMLLQDLRARSERSGHHADVVMDRLDAIIDTLKTQQFKIVSAMAENTELDT